MVSDTRTRVELRRLTEKAREIEKALHRKTPLEQEFDRLWACAKSAAEQGRDEVTYTYRPIASGVPWSDLAERCREAGISCVCIVKVDDSCYLYLSW